MGRLRFALALLGTAALAGAAGFAAGGRVGYLEGFALGHLSAEVVTGGLAQMSLRPETTPEEVRSALDLIVDLALVDAHGFENPPEIPFYAPGDVREIDHARMLRGLAKHRRGHASVHADDGSTFAKLRGAVVARYSQPKAP